MPLLPHRRRKASPQPEQRQQQLQPQSKPMSKSMSKSISQSQSQSQSRPRSRRHDSEKPQRQASTSSTASIPTSMPASAAMSSSVPSSLSAMNDHGNSSSRHAASHGLLTSVGSYMRSAKNTISRSLQRGDPRRIGNASDTLLPTTFSAAPSPSKPNSSSMMRGHHRTTSFPANSTNHARSNTCNSFLMGGNFYPGKDKKRRHMRRRTLWYRVFLSSPVRKTITILVTIYVLIYHILLPTVNYLLDIGKTLTRERHHQLTSDWLHHEKDIHVPSILKQQGEAIEVAAARALSAMHRHRGTNDPTSLFSRRSSILEAIVPEWYHRNDDSTAGSSVSSQGAHIDGANGQSKDQQRKTQQQQQYRDVYNNHTRISVVIGHDLKHRSLQRDNLHIRDERSSCPAPATATVATSKQNFQTTMVIQTTLSRLWILEETCQRWGGPIVVVVFIPYEKTVTAKDDIQHMADESICPNARFVHYQGTPEESAAKHYPINRLRNVGLDRVATSHVLVVDVDLVPSNDLYDLIAAVLPTLPNGENQQGGEDHHIPTRTTVVVPAFERIPPKPCQSNTECESYLKSNSAFLPQTFDELKNCVDDKECAIFQSSNNWEGHSTTNSASWLKKEWYQGESQELRVIPCFHTARYEPYLVVPWCGSTPTSVSASASVRTPYYDERFHGYGKNKIELVSHLRVMGYQFRILPQGFVVHNPHLESNIKEEWKDQQGSNLHAQMDKMYMAFLKDLKGKYTANIELQEQLIVPICDRQ